MKRKPQSQMPSSPDARVRVMATKVSHNELQELMPKILYFAGGNESLFIRAALFNYKPKKDDFKC